MAYKNYRQAISGAWNAEAEALNVVIVDGEMFEGGIVFSGATYVNSNTAASDAARRFETSEKVLRYALLKVTTKAQLLGNADGQTFEIAADGTLALQFIDLSTLYFKNKDAGQNGTVSIIGAE